MGDEDSPNQKMRMLHFEWTWFSQWSSSSGLQPLLQDVEDWILLEGCGRGETKVPWGQQHLFFFFLEVLCGVDDSYSSWRAPFPVCVIYKMTGLSVCFWKKMPQKSSVWGVAGPSHRTFLWVKKKMAYFSKEHFILKIAETIFKASSLSYIKNNLR